MRRTRQDQKVPNPPNKASFSTIIPVALTDDEIIEVFQGREKTPEHISDGIFEKITTALNLPENQQYVWPTGCDLPGITRWSHMRYCLIEFCTTPDNVVKNSTGMGLKPQTEIHIEDIKNCTFDFNINDKNLLEKFKKSCGKQNETDLKDIINEPNLSIKNPQFGHYQNECLLEKYSVFYKDTPIESSTGSPPKNPAHKKK